MAVEGREQVTCIWIVRVNGQPEELDGLAGRRQSSLGGTSRMSRETQVRMCVQRKLACSVGGESHRGKSQKPRSLDSKEEGN